MKKLTPRKVFILINGEYREITLAEHLDRRETDEEYQQKKFIGISFVNSFLEEFFFRGFSFLSLKECLNRNLAYTFSSAMFALYHIAMTVGWFSLPVVLLALLGLYIGGIIFNYINERFNTIYLSWLIHMFANFATNTIGYMLFNA